MSKTRIYLIGVPTRAKPTIINAIRKAIAMGRKRLAYQGPITIVIFEAPPSSVIPEIGLAGSAIGRSGIEIRIDFHRNFSKNRLNDEIASSIYHEMTHLVRERTLGYQLTLLETMLNEGVASYAEEQLSPRKRVPYIAAIKNENALLKKARPLFKKRNFNYGEWFFGAKKIPNWTGYRLGYLMVEKYMRKHKRALSDLVRTNARTISN